MRYQAGNGTKRFATSGFVHGIQIKSPPCVGSISAFGCSHAHSWFVEHLHLNFFFLNIFKVSRNCEHPVCGCFNPSFGVPDRHLGDLSVVQLRHAQAEGRRGWNTTEKLTSTDLLGWFNVLGLMYRFDRFLLHPCFFSALPIIPVWIHLHRTLEAQSPGISTLRYQIPTDRIAADWIKLGVLGQIHGD